MEFSKVPNGVKKAKKKPLKDELDRIKQAEKKKRRLEKALANSAAIRSELEKKKQKKVEEQNRLDQEGAAIAEAVALNVLLEEDADEYSSGFMLRQNDGLNNLYERLPCPYRNFPAPKLEEIGRVPICYGNWNGWGNSNSSILSGYLGGNNYMPYQDEISAELVLEQAVASLRLNEDARSDPCVFYSVF